MLVEIQIPLHYTTSKQKREFVEKVIKWGEENLNDQENWRYKSIWLRSNKFHLGMHTNNIIRLSIDDETDGMALKLAWTES